MLLGAASAIVVAAALHAVSWLVGPLFLALVIVITVYPVQTWLLRVGVPRWAATTLLVLLVYAVLIVLTATIVISIAQLATLLPAYAVGANVLVNRLSSLLAQVGVGNVQLAAIASSLSIGKLVAIVTSLLLGVTGLIGNAVFLLSLLLSVVGVFVVVNFVLTSLVQPKFVGAVGLSVTTVQVALVFWAWQLGILGAVLATPLTLLVKVVLIDVDPGPVGLTP